MYMDSSARHPFTLLTPVGLALVAMALVAGCGHKDEQSATQTAAKVNKEEVTVHQINAVLSQQRGLRPEQADEASRRALERLIDQELAIQKASELKLDRDPRVMQAIDAARRDIIARAYVDKLGEGAPKPTPAEIKQYYEEHPALFKQRKAYQFQEVAIEADAARIEALRPKLAAARTFADFVEPLRAAGVKFSATQAVRTAEQVPLAMLPAVAQMKDGSAMLTPVPNGVAALYLVASRSEPVDEERAARTIEQFLLNERKRKLLADDMKAMRAAAKIEYLGKFAASAPSVEPVKAPSVAEIAASGAALLDTKSIHSGLGLGVGAAAASAVAAADAQVKAASGVDAATISRGLGLK
jgi:EpsD family peptidyl-prolyl cis-trans isomerase